MTSEPTDHPAGDELTVTMPAVRLEDPTIPLVAATPEASTGDADGPALPPWEQADEDDEWQVSAPGRRIRMRVPTAVLVALLLISGAFWGGAAVQRSHSGSAGLAGAFASAAARLRGAAGASGASGSSGFSALFGGGGASAATVGTVTDVQGSTIYITNSAGDIVKVELSPSAKVTRTATVSASDLQLGDTVVVQGATAKNGTVTATSVTATAAGTSTTSARGAFAGLGSGG